MKQEKEEIYFKAWTKQEKIREGIYALFSNCFTRGKLSGKNGGDWANKYTDTLLADLKSEGVVRKVERVLLKREWDDTALGDAGQIGYDMAREDMADYEMVEELK